MSHSHLGPTTWGGGGGTGNFDPETWNDKESHKFTLGHGWYRARRQRVAVYH